jgi:hypothetical protein
MEMNQAVTEDTCVALEHTDEELIKRLCTVHEDEGLTWYDISNAKVSLAVKYLRLRGKLVTHPSGILVRFR